MTTRSRYGRVLRQTDFYEPETTVRAFRDDLEHDAGHFDSADHTFQAPHYKRYKYDNYDGDVSDRSVDMLGGSLRRLSLSGSGGRSSSEDGSISSGNAYESSFVSSDSNPGWSDASYTADHRSPRSSTSYDGSSDVTLYSESSN